MILKEAVSLKNDQLTFAEAIAVIEKDFWSRPSRTKRKQDKNNLSDLSSWNDSYKRFYKYLPEDAIVNLADFLKAINSYDKGVKSYKYAVSVMKKLARVNGRDDILEALEKLGVTQTEDKDLQTVTLRDFLSWRDKTLGITASLDDRADLDTRKAWLWVFSMQVVYGLRISEVFAIANLDKSFITKV